MLSLQEQKNYKKVHMLQNWKGFTQYVKLYYSTNFDCFDKLELRTNIQLSI